MDEIDLLSQDTGRKIEGTQDRRLFGQIDSRVLPYWAANTSTIDDFTLPGQCDCTSSIIGLLLLPKSMEIRLR